MAAPSALSPPQRVKFYTIFTSASKISPPAFLSELSRMPGGAGGTSTVRTHGLVPSVAPGAARAAQAINGMMRMATICETLIIGLIVGPAVSL